MKIKLKNDTCKKCKYKKIATQIIEKDEINPYRESPLPELPEPDYYYESFWSIKKIPPK